VSPWVNSKYGPYFEAQVSLVQFPDIPRYRPSINFKKNFKKRYMIMGLALDAVSKSGALFPNYSGRSAWVSSRNLGPSCGI